MAVIYTDLVLKCIEPIWDTVNDTARRVRGRIEIVLDWAKARSLRAGDNPARWRWHFDQLLPTMPKAKRVKHHPALPYAEVSQFMTELRARPSISAAALQSFLF